jgi:hypothetical protein
MVPMELSITGEYLTFNYLNIVRHVAPNRLIKIAKFLGVFLPIFHDQLVAPSVWMGDHTKHLFLMMDNITGN